MKGIISVVGKDRVGIIAEVCTLLSKHQINILDISQSITGGYFHMMMNSGYGKFRSSISSGGQRVGRGRREAGRAD